MLNQAKREHTAQEDRVLAKFIYLFCAVQGIGFGTPSERRKQYEQHRVEKAKEAVREHNVKKHTISDNSHETMLVTKDKKKAQDVKTR